MLRPPTFSNNKHDHRTFPFTYPAIDATVCLRYDTHTVSQNNPTRTCRKCNAGAYPPLNADHTCPRPGSGKGSAQVRLKVRNVRGAKAPLRENAFRPVTDRNCDIVRWGGGTRNVKS